MLSPCWCCPASQCKPLMKRIERTKLFICRSHALYSSLYLYCVCLPVCLTLYNAHAHTRTHARARTCVQTHSLKWIGGDLQSNRRSLFMQIYIFISSLSAAFGHDGANYPQCRVCVSLCVCVCLSVCVCVCLM